MKIPHEKQVAFLEKIISNTMTSPNCWNRMLANSVYANNIFPDDILDNECVFSYIFPYNLDGQFWIARCRNGKIKGAIGVDANQMEYFDITNEQINILLTRLFYLVFDARPNANKLIDEFLSFDNKTDHEDTKN